MHCFHKRFRVAFIAGLAACMVLMIAATSGGGAPDAIVRTPLQVPLQVGDVVFIRVPHLLYRKVADANASWTNHVGIVIDVSGGEAIVAESRVPRAGATTFSKFVARSENGRVAIRRLSRNLNDDERRRIVAAARLRFGQWYDLGFDFNSQRQFCSKFVREVLQQATGESVGAVETFSSLLARHPEADQRFWKWWYLGAIPWQRQTITPASQYESEVLHTVFDGWIVTPSSLSGHNSTTMPNPF
ncbi:MAG: YebB family permuted papain-like enzyme [Uliginosibacterium sp.]|nr:YebB family permuted papain-like enzyme [Uliginosibacterium sp.]